MDRSLMISEPIASLSSHRVLLLRSSAWAVLCTVAGWALSPAPAGAQISDAWTRASAIDVTSSPFSARLQAMGSLEVSVEEPQNRINAYGFSKNPAALLSDEDSSSVEVPWRYEAVDDGYYGYSHTAIQRGGSFRAALRNPGGQWVLGLESDFGWTNASRHDACPWPDDCRFLRDFDVQYPSYYQPTTADRTIGAAVEQPRLRITYGRTYFKKLTMAGRFGYRHESESRGVPNPYEIDLTSSSLEFTGGALYGYQLGSTALTAAGQIGWMGNHVKALSETPFNRDQFDWDRPQVSYSGQLVIRQGSWARGIVDVNHRSHDGEEVAQVNWAPQFFLNPLPINPNNPSESLFKRKWTSALSGIRRNEVGTRWMFDVPGTPAHVGVLYKYYRELEWIHPTQFVFQTIRELDVRRLGTQTNAGVSLDLPEGKGLLASEVHLSRVARTDYTGSLPEIAISEQSYHFGAEYRAVSWLPVRAGFVAIRRDWDRADAHAPVKGTRVTAGLGYFWESLKSQIDASFAHEHLHYTPGDPSGEISTGDQASLLVRYLF